MICPRRARLLLLAVLLSNGEDGCTVTLHMGD
jgi:hypothetical protein